jgi:biopolymer transport protein ExbD
MSRRQSPGSGVEPTLPITPMLDMAFQLLMFCVFNFHPSDLVEGQMEMALPADSISQAPKPQMVDPTVKPDKNALDLPSDLTVVVNTRLDGTNNGLISDLRVEDRAGTTNLNNVKELLAHLKKVREGLENRDGVKIQGHAKLKWSSVVEVMDVCREAGFKNVSFVPPKDFRLSAQ